MAFNNNNASKGYDSSSGYDSDNENKTKTPLQLLLEKHICDTCSEKAGTLEDGSLCLLKCCNKPICEACWRDVLSDGHCSFPHDVRVDTFENMSEDTYNLKFYRINETENNKLEAAKKQLATRRRWFEKKSAKLAEVVKKAREAGNLFVWNYEPDFSVFTYVCEKERKLYAEALETVENLVNTGFSVAEDGIPPPFKFSLGIPYIYENKGRWYAFINKSEGFVGEPVDSDDEEEQQEIAKEREEAEKQDDDDEKDKEDEEVAEETERKRDTENKRLGRCFVAILNACKLKPGEGNANASCLKFANNTVGANAEVFVHMLSVFPRLKDSPCVIGENIVSHPNVTRAELSKHLPDIYAKHQNSERWLANPTETSAEDLKRDAEKIMPKIKSFVTNSNINMDVVRKFWEIKKSQEKLKWNDEVGGVFHPDYNPKEMSNMYIRQNITLKELKQNYDLIKQKKFDEAVPIPYRLFDAHQMNQVKWFNNNMPVHRSDIPADMNEWPTEVVPELETLWFSLDEIIELHETLQKGKTYSEDSKFYRLSNLMNEEKGKPNGEDKYRVSRTKIWSFMSLFHPDFSPQNLLGGSQKGVNLPIIWNFWVSRDDVTPKSVVEFKDVIVNNGKAFINVSPFCKPNYTFLAHNRNFGFSAFLNPEFPQELSDEFNSRPSMPMASFGGW